MTKEQKTTLIETRPDFLAPSDPSQSMVGMEQDDGRQLPSFLKVIQPTTKEPYKPPFSDGDLIITPQNQLVISSEDSFNFVPVFFFYEYAVHNPIQVRGLEFIREKSLDPTGDIAKRAKAQDFNARHVPCPENPKYELTYVEHLNFLIMLLDHNTGLENKPVVISFFKSGWKYGMMFKDLIKARSSQCPYMYGCQFRAHMVKRTNNEGTWYGVNVTNPAEVSPWVTEEARFKVYEALYSGFKTAYESNDLNVDYGNEKENVTDSEKAKEF